MGMAGSWMRGHTLQCRQGVFSQDRMQDYEFLVINTHSMILRRQLKEAILLDWAQSRGVFNLGKKVVRVNRRVHKFEHWRPKPVFIVGR